MSLPLFTTPCFPRAAARVVMAEAGMVYNHRMAAQDVFAIGDFTVTNRLFVGTGKYKDYDVMQRALDASACQVVTVAVRRERLVDVQGRSLLDFLDLSKYVILPNTAGCFTADDAIRVALLGRDLLEKQGNKGAGWVKLEVLGDKKTLLPDPVGTIEATRELVKEGFTVLAYTSDDPRCAVRIKEAGAASVMPAGSPIGSGQGVLNPLNISLCLELLKEGDANFPVIVDAGVGAASDVTIAMELGADGVLLNTGIAHASDPVKMALAMKHALEAGRLSYQAGRIGKKRYATASSPFEGVISYIPGE
jgi:thiazole synthase